MILTAVSVRHDDSEEITTTGRVLTDRLNGEVYLPPSTDATSNGYRSPDVRDRCGEGWIIEPCEGFIPSFRGAQRGN